jgi:ribosome-associated protein
MADRKTLETMGLRGSHITLAQALKVAGFASSGGQAKNIVRQGMASVNGIIEHQPGRKLIAGDRFGLGGVECLVTPRQG